MNEPRVIGVDLGGTKILTGIVTRDGTIERRRETPTPVESQEAVLAGLDAAVEELLDESVVAIGFGIPSRIDQQNGRVLGLDRRRSLAPALDGAVARDDPGQDLRAAEVDADDAVLRQHPWLPYFVDGLG